MKVLHNDISLLEALLIGKMIHEVKESSILTAVNKPVLGFGELLVELGMLGTGFENIVEHVHVVAMNSL